MRNAIAAAAIALLTVAPVEGQLAQRNLGAAVHFQGYAFESGLGVTAANLFLVPVAYELPITRTVSLDAYSAYARGSVEINDTVFNMSGFVDTRVRANWAVAPWAMLTVGVNLPTGNSKHSGEEAVVSNVLATEVLGFREASWGLGFGATTGIATAYRVGRLGIGLGASYRLASEFEPSADTALKYTPGNETRFRVALDTDLGSSSKLTGGVTFQHYAKDALDGRDLFQPGQRWRGDVALSFRTGTSASWTVFATDIWRQHGDVSLPDTVISTGKQNLIVAGLAGAIRLTQTFSLRPSADVRILSREDQGGDGWIAGVGTDVPLRLGSMDLFPSARFLFGQLSGAATTKFQATGAEVGLSLRWGGN